MELANVPHATRWPDPACERCRGRVEREERFRESVRRSVEKFKGRMRAEREARGSTRVMMVVLPISFVSSDSRIDYAARWGTEAAKRR